MLFITSNLKDIYKCPYCSTLIAMDDRYCSDCGRLFTAQDVIKMRYSSRLTFGRITEIILLFAAITAFLFVLVFASRAFANETSRAYKSDVGWANAFSFAHAITQSVG